MKLFIICLALLACSAYAQTPCFARISASPRPESSWSDGFTQFQVYDISATNAGTCALNRVVGFFSAGPGRISESWNYDSSTGLITGFGGVLEVGQTFNGAGFVLANSSSPSLAFDRPGCDDTCSATSTTPSPTTTPPSTGSCDDVQCNSNQICIVGLGGPACNPRSCDDLQCSSADNQVCINDGGYARCITTGGPSSTTAAPTTAAPSCSIVAQVVRDGNSWADAQGRNTSVYRLVVTNQGPCALATYVTSFAYYPGVLVTSWNLSPSLGGYLVTGYGETLAAHATYNGAGLILSGAPETVYADAYGTTCKC